MIRAVSFRERLERYVNGVVSGDITAGKWVRLACKRHLDDLDRIGRKGFGYFFDWDEAEQVCEFFPLCFRHSKGKWARQPFELSDWQLFIVASLFGWRRETTAEEQADGMPRYVRRFRRALVSVARKNGKTTLAAGIGLYMATADGENVAEIYTAATKMEQAKLCLFAEAKRMISQSNHLKKRSKLFTGSISFPMMDSYIRPLGSDRAFDGLNPHCVILDEIHAWREQHRNFFNTMKTGSGSRDQPLLLSITTAGDDKSELWIEETSYVKGVLSGSFLDESIFGFIAEIDEDDDPFDEENWHKSNPCLGESVSADYIRELASEAKAVEAKKNTFLRYHCNTMVSSQSRAFNLDVWDSCAGKLTDWRKADCVCAGLDIGTRDDLAAYGLCARYEIDRDDEDTPIYRYEFRSRAFMSESTRRNLEESPWPEFFGKGLLEKHKYVVSATINSLIKDCHELGVSFIAFDNYQAQMPAEEFEKEGIKCIPMPQIYSHFNEPINELQSALADGRVVHEADLDRDSLLRWCASNAVIVQDRNERKMYDKTASKYKIDPIVAMTMALKAAMKAPQRSRGPLFVF